MATRWCFTLNAVSTKKVPPFVNTVPLSQSPLKYISCFLMKSYPLSIMLDFRINSSDLMFRSDLFISLQFFL